MTNIWADTYKQIRDPFFQIKDPYTVSEEKKEKKEPGEKKHKEGPKEEKDEKKKEDKESPKRWWDDDGDGEGYEKGEVEGKFKKKKKVEEEVEQIDEISPEFVLAASKAADKKGKPAQASRLYKKFAARDQAANYAGYQRSSVKKEEVENKEYMDEAQVANRDPDKYEAGEKKKYAPVRGERTPMPPRGNKKREDFEKWYAANVKEERDLYSKTNKNDKIDVRKELKNKINTKPTVSEEVEAWVDELISEGYDLSEFTWEEVTEIYESVQLDEGNTSTMPPRGDAETVKVDPMAAARAKAARAKVSKEIADLQVAKQAQRTKVTTTESVLTFIEDRYDLSEAVFNPKRDKMRPASERTQKVMTDAQRKAAKAKEARAEKLETEADKILNTMKSGPARRSSAPMGTTRSEKPEAPEANRKLGKQRKDTLASKADRVLKGIKDK